MSVGQGGRAGLVTWGEMSRATQSGGRPRQGGYTSIIGSHGGDLEAAGDILEETFCGPGCEHGLMFREAGTADLWALTELERESNQTALRHVFPPERFPFPDDDVLARWALVLDEPGATVLVHDAPERDGHLDVLAAYDARSLRHLAVHPDRWDSGLASWAVDTVLQAMAARGTTEAELWCLELNHRARQRYEHLGWRPTTDRRPTPWPPHPTEMRYRRLVPRGH